MNNPLSSSSTEDAFESGRKFAGQAIERANERARELRSGMQDMAQRGLSTVADSAQAAQRQLGQYANATGRYVAEQPIKSALIAAAIGAAGRRAGAGGALSPRLAIDLLLNASTD
jgi:ElaB/YqjD/DUF883 family membrane-anchored ribosome-binding protein